MVVTDNKYVKITKRDPNTGNLIGTAKRITTWGDTFTQDTLINQLYTDLLGAADQSFYLIGENLKPPYLYGAFASTSFVAKFDLNLDVQWLLTDPTEMGTGT